MSAFPGYLAAQASVVRGPLLFSGALSEGQFYSPPESFAGDGLVGGETAFREGIYKEWAGLDLFFLFLLSVGSLGKASLPHTRLYAPHPAFIPDSSYLPTSSHCHRCLFSAGSDNESDEEVAGKKSFSAQVFGCPPPPCPWSSQHWPPPGWAGASQPRVDPSSLNAGQCPSEC